MDRNLLKIRKATTKDARGWFTLNNKVWRDAYSHIFPEEVFLDREQKLEKRIEMFDDLVKNDNENISYVAEYDGRVIGMMCGCINSYYKKFHDKYADLNALYVDPKFQGLGIGSSLKNIFEEWAIENGATQYVIGVLKDNTEARKIYESWGGKLSEHEQDFIKLGIGYPEVFYTYDLQKEIKKHI